MAPSWLGEQVPPAWTSRYGQRGDDWRLPRRAGRAELAVAVGRDGLLLLEAVQVLRAAWIQRFYPDSGQVRWRDKHSGLPPGSRMLLDPTNQTPVPATDAAATGAAAGHITETGSLPRGEVDASVTRPAPGQAGPTLPHQGHP